MPVVLTNRIALFYRGFMALFLAGVALITWVAVRDRATLEGSEWLALVLLPFWLAGLFGCWWAFRQDTVRVEVTGPGRLELTRSTLFRSTRVEITATMIGQITVVEDRDSNGDPYFRGVLTAVGVGNVTISEGHRRASVENDVNRLRSALSI